MDKIDLWNEFEDEGSEESVTPAKPIARDGSEWSGQFDRRKHARDDAADNDAPAPDDSAPDISAPDDSGSNAQGANDQSSSESGVDDIPDAA